MSTLLVTLKGNVYFNWTMFPPYLYVYDDKLLYKKRAFISVREITIAYSHIAQVNLLKGLFFARIEIVSNGIEKVIIKFISKRSADKAKKIIDQKIYFAHAKEKPDHVGGISGTPVGVHNIEKSINRLKELVNKGVISEREYNSRKSKLLKDIE